MPVDIFVAGDGLQPTALEGVSVAVLSDTTSELLANALTDSDGRAAFLLPGGIPGVVYEVRLYKKGVAFANPQHIEVLDPLPIDDLNQFDVTGTLFPPEVSNDPRTCRCTGYFVGFDNSPLPGTNVRIASRQGAAEQVPLVVDGRLVAADSINLNADAHGQLVIDLLRGGRYYVSVGDEDNTWDILVPDRPSANLIDLIHPCPVSLAWGSPAVSNTLTLKVGDSLNVDLSLLFSNFETLTEGLSPWILLSSSDPQVAATVLSGEDKAAINGLAVGTVMVTATAAAVAKPARVPIYSLNAPTLQVVVTP
jgi:hypothetical protein